MIDLITKRLVREIADEVQAAKYYSIECDEVTSHKCAFMSVVLQYVKDFKICGRLMKLKRVKSLTGKDLSDSIVEVLNPDISNLVDKGFDGASNMLGKDEGIQQNLY